MISKVKKGRKTKLEKIRFNTLMEAWDYVLFCLTMLPRKYEKS